jgi:hypothetical protein
MGNNLSVMEQRLKRKGMPRKHSLALWIVYLGFAWLAFSGLVRMIDSIVNWYWYTFAGIRPGPWYLTISGGLWGVSGLAALIWLLFALPQHRRVAVGIAVFYSLTYWLDRLFASQQKVGLANSAFPVLLTILGLVFIFLALRPWHEIKGDKEHLNDKK